MVNEKTRDFSLYVLKFSLSRIVVCSFLVLFSCTRAADIDEVEAQWKMQFHEWNTRYIVDWKAQFDRYVRHTNKLQSHNIFGHGHDDL